MPVISQATQKLIQKYQSWHQSQQAPEGTTTIHVDEVASKVAAFYEKIRGVVDWREEHLMRRGAISRMLKRRLVLTKDSKTVTEPLILELIRGGHFPNDRIEESKIGVVQKSIEKYLYISENRPANVSERRKMQTYNWLMDVAACEIEEIVSPLQRERGSMEYMTDLMQERIKLNQGVLVIGGMNEEEKNTQIYIAVQRALFKLDSAIICYHLLKRRYPEWFNLSPSQLQEITDNIYIISDDLAKEMNCRLGDKFYRICERYDTPYLLLGDILSKENPLEIEKKIASPETVEGLVREAYTKRYTTLKKRLYRAAFYSTLSIFLTNVFSIIILEWPVAQYLLKMYMGPLTIVVDILGPTFLMLILVLTISLPPKSNLDVVIMETMKIIYQREKNDTYEIKVPKKRGAITKTLIALIYILGASLSFGVVIWVFELAKFPPTSVLINLMLVALIAFAGTAVRERSKELTVEEKPGNVLGFFFDVLFLPVVSTGRWLSNKWKQYNAVAAFFNALIDMPFTIFVEFLEQWRYFLKEKKEEIH
ncbi:MAG: hypothetical protein COS25_01325 [Candidatus Nealsonbacteria bacterium CG02_land_8_20_14_3_00_37_10]|uniref:Uncharacterized protein n=1 Tax=Candidatus Nealsonbacteria bacterium CG02_land_8_20_14_3_00_37_10 TaxID=1974699 RepID=A0A2M7D9N9_9BACT|nr:MAG: hypothetical protein COS25_01325 [Candidatus Nealsonbacteria bacterium CG02_land_8_20_14_3_00_37_10]